MRLLILCLNYAPEPTGFAPHTTAIAEHLAKAGHQVTVATGFPFAPGWVRSADSRGEFVRRQLVNGVDLVRVTHFIPRRPSAAWQRVTMEASFCVTAGGALMPALFNRRIRPEVVLYVGAQPAIAMLARGIAAAIRVPYFVNINDLAAQAASDVGIVRSGWLQRVLERIEFAAYRSAAGASVLCRSFADTLVARGYPADRIRLIRCPIDIEVVRPLTPGPEYREGLGLPSGAFIVLFAGSMGLKQGLGNVVEAARRLSLRSSPSRDVLWVLAGDGEMRVRVEALVAEHGLGNQVRVLPFQSEDKVAFMLAAADVLLLNQVAAVKDTVVPSKLMTYMAAGRPVLAAVNESSQGAEILREADGGLLISPDDPNALVEGVERMRSASIPALAAMGERNRAYAERHFDRKKILAEHESFLFDQFRQPQRGPAPRPAGVRRL